MAITKVSESTFNVGSGSGTETKSLPGTLQENDIVLVIRVSPLNLNGDPIVTSGYTTVYDSNDNVPGSYISRKKMGSSPDANVEINQQSGNWQAGIIRVYRGVDPATPEDATATVASNGGDVAPDSPPITTVTDGALVLSIGFMDDDNDKANITAPSGYGDLLAFDNTGGPTGSTVMIASKTVSTAGAENPGAFGTVAVDSMHAVTMALRPVLGDPPVLTVPGEQSATFGTPKVISGSGVADTDTDVDTLEASCESGMTITLDPDAIGSPPAVITGNGTNAVSYSGTQSEIDALLDAITVDHAEIFPTETVTKTVTLRVVDAQANEDIETIDVVWTPPTSRYQVLTGTPTEIIDALQALDWTPPTDETGNFNFRMIAETDAPLSDTDDFEVTVEGPPPVLTVPSLTLSGQYGTPKSINTVSVAHAASLTSSLRFQSPAAMALSFDEEAAGSPPADLTGDGTNDVLIESDHAGLNLVAATLQATRATPVTPVPSSPVAASGNTYTVRTNLQAGDTVYTDRAYTFTSVPSALLGAGWIQTPNDDKGSAHAATLQFTLNAPAWVYITLDSRFGESNPVPDWMVDWELTALTTLFNDAVRQVTHFVYRTSFPAGTVTLGGYNFGTLYSHYTVIILPIAATVAVTVTATDSNGNTDVETFDVAWSTGGNQLPIANAGPDQNVVIEEAVQLDGSGSSDPEAASITYLWTMTEKPPASATVLSNATIVNPTFTPDLPGTYVIRLVVNDGEDNSAPDHITVTAGGILVANAGPDQLITAGSLVQLDGSGSLNYDTLTWEFLLKPDGSLAALSDATIVNPTFLPDLPGAYVLRLTAYDAASPAESTTDNVTITASELAAIIPMFVAAHRTATVPGDKRGVVSAGAALASVWKYPKDLYDVAVDWSGPQVLPAGATSLSTLVVSIIDPEAGSPNDVSDTLILNYGESPVTGWGTDGLISWVTVQGGTKGKTYRITFRQTFDNGQIREKYVDLVIRRPRKYVTNLFTKYPNDKFPVPVQWAGREPRGSTALSTLITKAYDASDVDETSTYVAGSFVAGTIGAGYIMGGTGGESRLLEFAQQFSNGRTFHEYAMLTVEVPPA